MRRTVVVNLALAALAASCGGKTPTASLALDDFAPEASAAACDYFVRCHLISDLDICRAFIAFNLTNPTFENFASMIASARADKAGYDGVKARACVERMRATECTRAPPDVLSECAGAFTGKVAVGDRCIASVACVRGSACVH